MKRIDIRELVLWQKSRWHTWPAGKDDESKAIGQDQCTSRRLEDLGMKDRVGISHESDCGRDMDHGICPDSISTVLIPDSLVEKGQHPWMSHDDLLQTQLYIDTKPLLDLDDLTSVYLRQSSSILTHGKSLHRSGNLVCPVPASEYENYDFWSNLREEPVPYFHQEGKHAQESTGQLHPKPCCVRYAHRPDQQPHLLPIPSIIGEGRVDRFGKLMGSDDVL